MQLIQEAWPTGKAPLISDPVILDEIKWERRTSEENRTSHAPTRFLPIYKILYAVTREREEHVPVVQASTGVLVRVPRTSLNYITVRGSTGKNLQEPVGPSLLRQSQKPRRYL
jgi:hypothetical protein